MSNEEFSLRDPKNQNTNEHRYREDIGPYFEQSRGTTLNKLENFTRFVPRQTLALFLAKNALFEKIVNVHGSIVECGVFMGGGLFTWAQLSAIYEPVNHNRKIIGFDTFDGFPELTEKDAANETGDSALSHRKTGGYRFDGEEELRAGVKLYDQNRLVGHVNKMELVKGDALQTIPEYVEDNPHTVVSLLYLDFDLFEPTIAALKAFLPRMPKGAVIAFDELNQSYWPGETLAVMEAVGLNNLQVRRFPFTPALSYAVID